MGKDKNTKSNNKTSWFMCVLFVAVLLLITLLIISALCNKQDNVEINNTDSIESESTESESIDTVQTPDDIVTDDIVTDVLNPMDFDKNALEGEPLHVPNLEKLGYVVLYQEGMKFKVKVCGNCKFVDGVLVNYFTNISENDVYLQIKILNEDEKEIGTSGLLKPNQYINGVKLNEHKEMGDKITMRIYAYDPETLEKIGSAVLKTAISTGAVCTDENCEDYDCEHVHM